MFKFVVKRNSKELFHRAVAENDVLRVKLLLDECKEDAKFNIDEINEEGLTALQNSCFIGNIEMVKLLVSYGGNLKIKDRDGWSLLHGAVMAGNFSLVQFLVESGLNINSKTDRKETPIDFANNKEMLIYLVKKMIDIGLIEEVQAFIKRKPRYKKEIYKEIELSIQAKRDEIKALEKFPISAREKREKHSKAGKTSRKNVDGTKSHQQHHIMAGNVKQSGLNKQEKAHRPKLEKGHIREIFTVDVDNLPESPTRKQWSSLTDLCESSKYTIPDTKLQMHNGYDTDGNDVLLSKSLGCRVGESSRQTPCPDPRHNSNQQEVDIVSVNSHSTSGYETDENPLLYMSKYAGYENCTTIKERVENNNEIDSSDYFKRSHTMSPRTMRRLGHRFGFSVVTNSSKIRENNSQEKSDEMLKQVEYPEIFL